MSRSNNELIQGYNKNIKTVARQSRDRQSKNNPRSPFDNIGGKINSIIRKPLIYTLYNRVQTWRGKQMTFDHCPILSDLLLKTKIRTKTLINIIFGKGSPESLLQFRDQQNPNSQFNLKLKNIIAYFTLYQQRLEQQRKILRKILNNFGFIFPYAYWYFIFNSENIYDEDFDLSYFQEIDQQFRNLNKKKKKFSKYISKLPYLDLNIICQPFLEKMKEESAEDRKGISPKKMEQYAMILNQQKGLKVKNNCNKRSEFKICKLSLENFSHQEKLDMMEQFITYTNALLSLNDKTPQDIPKRHVSKGLTVEHIRKYTLNRSYPKQEKRQIQESRSRFSDVEEQSIIGQSQMQMQQNNNLYLSKSQDNSDTIIILNNNQQEQSTQSQSIFLHESEILSVDKLFEVFDPLILIQKASKQCNRQQNKYHLMSQNLMQQEEFDNFHKQPEQIHCQFWADKRQQTNGYFLMNLLKQ